MADEVRTKESVSNDLAVAMRSAILRFETIQETNPEISLDVDLAYYRRAMEWFDRIPSMSDREAAFTNLPSEKLTEQIAAILLGTVNAPEQVIYKVAHDIVAFTRPAPSEGLAGLRNAYQQAVKNAEPNRGEMSLHATDWIRLRDEIEAALIQADALREALADAYVAGATAVHNEWMERHPSGALMDNYPEFGEAADDYARQALARTGDDND